MRGFKCQVERPFHIRDGGDGPRSPVNLQDGARTDRIQEKAQMIPTAISMSAANATKIDSATAATGFTGRGASRIGTDIPLVS
jgi:hypothetical protein